MKNSLLTIGMAALFALSFTITARAQLQKTSDQNWPMLVLQEGQWTNVLTGTAPADLAEKALEDFSVTDWKKLRSQLLKTIHTAKGAEWEHAVQQTIFLALFFNDKINLNRASLDLLESYILDRNEAHRIMALTAIHAIGNSDILGRLAQRVNTEESNKVRRLTIAALADHYGMKDFYGRRLVMTPTLGK